MGLLASARPVTPPESLRLTSHALASAPGPAPLRDVLREARGTVPTAERLQHDLHPLSAFLVVPLFALANMGVRLEPAALAGGGAAAVLAGVVVGRVVGKLLGITAAVWLAVRLGVAPLPTGTTWRQLAGVATVAGVGLTVPLFVAGLAFPDGRFDAAVKLGLVAATLVSGAAGFLVLRRSAP
jgi:NhaA family Na+:H+ antiporter